MNDDPGRDRTFGEVLARRPELAARASAIMSESGGTDGALLARRVLEHALGTGPAGIAEQAYGEAAAALHASGNQDEARTLRTIADTSSALAATERDWHGRYLGRPPTAAERKTARHLASGVVLPSTPRTASGADGALYRHASIYRRGTAANPAVIVTGHAGAADVTWFPHVADQDRWLANRVAGAPPSSDAAAAGADGRPPCWSPATHAAPLRSCDDGAPDCRTAREERLLAWLLRGGEPSTETRMQLRARTFTTYARSEAYLAWLTARAMSGSDQGPAAARDELARQLLRAPAWAAPLVGWPFGHHALAYFDRLQATPVTTPQAAAAARTLIAEDAQAAAAAAGIQPGSARARARQARLVPRPRPGQDWDPPRVPRQRRPDDPSPGPAPRR